MPTVAIRARQPCANRQTLPYAQRSRVGKDSLRYRRPPLSLGQRSRSRTLQQLGERTNAHRASGPVPGRREPLRRERGGAALKEAINESYGLVREHETMLRTSDRLEEKLRARRIIRELWAYIRGCLDEYRRLASGVLPDDLEELATHL